MGRLRSRFALLLLLLVATAAAADPVRQVSLPANDLAYDPVTGKIYASVPSSAGARGNSITAIDPETGQVGASVFIGSEPGKIAIGDKGGILWVSLDGAAAVRRFDTGTQTAGTQFSLGSNYGPNYAEDLAVPPGQPASVAVSLYNKGISPRHVNVTIFDNGVPRPKVAAGANVITFGATASRIYGYHSEISDFTFVRWNVDNTGIVSGDGISLLSGYGQGILYDGGRIYGTNGGVYDPEAGTLLGTLPGGPRRPDSKLNRVFILQGDGANVQLLAYDATTFLKLWSAKIAGVNGGVGSLIRWGADGLAFRSSSGQIFLLHTGELNAPPPPNVGTPRLTVLANPVESGVTTAAQVTIDQPVRADVWISLSSSNPAAAEVPASVIIPAGATSAKFSIVTHLLTADSSVTLTASVSGASGITSLSLLAVTAQPGLPARHLATVPVYDPANGHWYQDARGPNLSWDAARVTAGGLTYKGLQGHLVSLTSPEESDFLIRTFIQGTPPGYEWWLGGYQDRSATDYREPAGGWHWVAGEPWSYTDWDAGQPDNGGGAEDNLEIRYNGLWNDRPNAATLGGYFVEYEAAAAPPPATPPSTPPQLLLFPNPVPGGMLALGQVLLGLPAGAGGGVISLNSSSPAAAVVPASIAVPAGASTVTFPIATFPVAAPTLVTITAGSASGPLTAVLQVLPLSTPLPTTPNLLVNGSFEAPALPAGLANETLHIGDDLPGWRVLGGSVDVVNGLASGGWQPAPDGGGQSLDLVGNPGAGTIQQSFATEPGRTYLFSGWISHAWGIREGRANVLLNGAFFAQLLHSNDLYGTVTPADLRWQPFSLPFRATSATTTLTLTDVTGLSPIGGAVLDGLSVTPTGDTDAAPVAGLAPPGNLHVTMGIEANVRLFWIDSSSGQAGFEVWRKIGRGDWARLVALPPNTPAFVDAGVGPSTLFTYRVRATSSQGVSPWSAEASLTTPAAPAAPTALASPDPGRLPVFLTWSSTSVNATAIELYRRDPGAGWKLIAVLAPNVVGTTDRTALPGTTYTYRVRAANDYFASAWSNEFNYTTPAGL